MNGRKLIKITQRRRFCETATITLSLFPISFVVIFLEILQKLRSYFVFVYLDKNYFLKKIIFLACLDRTICKSEFLSQN
jgi:hypothetical protein